MSIEKRVFTLSRSFRSLIEKGASKSIKVLQTLNLFAGTRATDIKVLQTLGFVAASGAIDIKVLKDLKRTRDVFLP